MNALPLDGSRQQVKQMFADQSSLHGGDVTRVHSVQQELAIDAGMRVFQRGQPGGEQGFFSGYTLFRICNLYAKLRGGVLHNGGAIVGIKADRQNAPASCSNVQFAAIAAPS